MTRLRLVKTSFTAGELDPRLLGRIDLKAQEDGASRLRNVLVQATGGVTRRPGTMFVAAVPGATRLLGFDGADGGELLAIAPFRIDVLKGTDIVASVATPWGAAQIPELAWARTDDTLLLCHPEVAPQRLVRAGAASWSLTPWSYDDADDGTAYPASHQPYARFAADDVALQAIRQGPTQAASLPIPAGSTVLLRASDNLFKPLHQGVRIRLRGREVLVTNPSPTDPHEAVGLVLQDLVNGMTTRRWDEQAFSPARGYPRTIVFHQDRLVVGGSRDLADCLWFSRSGRPFDFDPGTGLDDEAISFRLRAEQRHQIVNLHGGRRLEVFTGAGEWVVTGFPLTPTTVQASQQTSVGCYRDRRLPLLDVDGATLFVGASGRDLREFLFTDTEQAYQAADIALLSRHLMLDPVDLAFDPQRRLLLLVRGDGATAAVVIDRNSNVVAWSLLSTSGSVLAAHAFQGRIFLLVQRAAQTCLEQLDDAVGVDAAATLSSTTARLTWTLPAHLAGGSVTAVADGSVIGPLTPSGRNLTLPSPARQLTVGRAYTHEISALPLMAAAGRDLAPNMRYRPLRVTFRLLETSALSVDMGDGPRPLALNGPQAALTGDISLRALGWRHDVIAAPWRIVQDSPLPCTVLAVTTEIKVNE